MLDFHTAAADPCRGHGDQIVIINRPAIGNVKADDDEKGAIAFHLGVGKPTGAKKLGAGDFKPCDVVGVVGYAHGVALAVADADIGGAGADGRY